MSNPFSRKYHFDVAKNTKACIEWIKNWFEKTGGSNANAVIGMSGGKDSTIAAALCVQALGPDRVIGVAMPTKGQGLNEADKICEYLGIKFLNIPIDGICASFDSKDIEWSVQTEQNIPPRVRMTMLYAIAQTYNGRPCNTCNLSEDYVGYATLFGDSAGSFSPTSGMTVTELLQVGDYLGIPHEWVHKTPDDGLPHSSPDEDKFGFTYCELDKYIREGIAPFGPCNNNREVLKLEKIQVMHFSNEFKTQIIQGPHFEPEVYTE